MKSNNRDPSHNEQIERWAEYVRDNPTEWKKHMKPFIDAQILMARRFYKELSKTNEGREKIKKLRELRT
ncbi:MAG: hypothetical protein NUV58_04035 [Candidatus Roizmanbacteria bacterium]|nr:hypothetical protein [Candidatus Roizmanbacteria bacterium]